eukprot:10570018-Lingulodinium_polyedra.AAC.1
MPLPPTAQQPMESHGSADAVRSIDDRINCLRAAAGLYAQHPAEMWAQAAAARTQAETEQLR